MNISFTKSQLSFYFGLYLVVLGLTVLDARFSLQAIRMPFSFLLRPIISIETGIEAHFSRPFTRLSTLLNAQQLVTDLQNRNIELQTQIAQAEFTAEENKALKLEIEKGNTEQIERANTVKEAQIISEGQVSFMNKGSTDGIEMGNILTMQGVLVGKVKEVEPFFSSIDLFTEGSFQVIGQTENGVKGIVTGKDGTVRLTQVRADQKVEVGEAVFSSGSMNDEVPIGMFIGEIKSIEQDPGAPFQEAEINQLITSQTIRVVRVLGF